MAFIVDEKDLVTDKDLHSPMIGLYSGFKELRKLGYEKVFTLSCDMPLIKYEAVELMISESESYDCVIPKWENGFYVPLFAIYPTLDAFKKTEENLKNRSFKLISVLDDEWNINFISVEYKVLLVDSNLTSFININDTINIKKLVKKYSSDIKKIK